MTFLVKYKDIAFLFFCQSPTQTALPTFEQVKLILSTVQKQRAAHTQIPLMPEVCLYWNWTTWQYVNQGKTSSEESLLGAFSLHSL